MGEGQKGSLTWCALDDQFHLRHVFRDIFFNLQYMAESVYIHGLARDLSRHLWVATGFVQFRKEILQGPGNLGGLLLAPSASEKKGHVDLCSKNGHAAVEGGYATKHKDKGQQMLRALCEQFSAVAKLLPAST